MAVGCQSGGVGSFSRKVDFQLPSAVYRHQLLPPLATSRSSTIQVALAPASPVWSAGLG